MWKEGIDSRMSNKYKKLAKNTAIFAIGNFGSKILSFLILPLYTYVLTTSEYGIIDLFSTSLGLIIPFSTMLIYEALLRFVLGKELDPKSAVSTAFVVFLLGSLISVILVPVYKRIFSFQEYIWIFVILLIFNTFTQIFSQYLRAVGKNKAFTINGLLVTAVSLFSNIIFLLHFKLGVKGYLYSLLCAQIVSSIYIIISGRIISKISFKSISKHSLRQMLLYSIPLIPNSLMWWIMSAGDKYIINYYLGNSYNGIYSLAMKIPTIVNMVYAFFYQAWQLSAIEEDSQGDKKEFYENVFKIVSAALFLTTACINMFVKPVYVFVMSESFRSAWLYVPLLSVATILSCSSSFFGVVYTTTKRTKGIFLTTGIGAIVNLLLNFFLIQPLGLQGVTIGTSIGYLVITIIRARDTKKSIGMNMDIVRVSVSMLILISQSIFTILINSLWIYVIGGGACIALVMLYFKEIRSVYETVIVKKRNSKKGNSYE